MLQNHLSQKKIVDGGSGSHCFRRRNRWKDGAPEISVLRLKSYTPVFFEHLILATATVADKGKLSCSDRLGRSVYPINLGSEKASKYPNHYTMMQAISRTLSSPNLVTVGHVCI